MAAFGDELAGAVGRSAPLVVLGALLAGGLIGEAAGLEGRLERLGEAVKRRLGGQASFVLASLVACVGPLAVLGAFADGLHGDVSLLAVKSLLDGFAILTFASYLGWGVAASGLAVLAYQGGLTGTRVIDDRLVLLDYRIADQSGG